jgi:parallel beta-helix repeat protein
LYVTNVTIKNIKIKNFYYGILLNRSSNNIITKNEIIGNNWAGIVLSGSPNFLIGSTHNIISRNKISDNGNGIEVYWYSSYNIICGNSIISNYGDGITFHGTSNKNNIICGNNITVNRLYGIELSGSYNIIAGNDILNNSGGIGLYWRAYHNAIYENNIVGNKHGIYLYTSSNNVFFHNNFINNINQVNSFASLNNWDNGYLSGGNYWSDYNGIDKNRDGIGDTPYIIDENNPRPNLPATATLTLSISREARPGNYTLTITGISGNITRRMHITLEIKAPGQEILYIVWLLMILAILLIVGNYSKYFSIKRRENINEVIQYFPPLMQAFSKL